MNYKRKVLWLIVVATLIRIIIAATLYLGNDEVYYRLFANKLQWNYFDHPPFVALLIKLTTFGLKIDNDVTIRLGAILFAGLTTYLMYLCGKKLSNERTGYFAALLYNINFYTSIIAGTFILPDSPQVFFWTLGIYLLLYITDAKSITHQKKVYLLYFGIVTGLGLLCKIHSIFLWVGFFTYCLLYYKKWFLQPIFYISILIAAVFMIPIIVWNFNNDFITFTYHGSRVALSNTSISWTSFLQFNLGQFFYQNPFLIVLMVISLLKLYKNKIAIFLLQKNILLCLSIPLIIVATFISLFKQVLPHWTGPAFISLLLIAATHLAEKKEKAKSIFYLPKLLQVGVYFYLLVVLLGLIFIRFAPYGLGSKEMAKRGSEDFSVDMYGWKEMQKKFAKIIQKNKSTNTYIVSNGWVPAAHLQHYVGEPLGIPVLAFGSIDKIHQYHWWNKKEDYKNKLADFYLVVPSNYFFEKQTIAELQPYSPTAQDTLSQYRNGFLLNYYVLYYYKNVVMQ